LLLLLVSQSSTLLVLLLLLLLLLVLRVRQVQPAWLCWLLVEPPPHRYCHRLQLLLH
jgi:hypothetical protein